MNMHMNTWLTMKLCKRYGIPYSIGTGKSTINGVPISKYTTENLLNLSAEDFKNVIINIKERN